MKKASQTLSNWRGQSEMTTFPTNDNKKTKQKRQQQMTGASFLEFANTNNLVLSDTLDKHKKSKKVTWLSSLMET